MFRIGGVRVAVMRLRNQVLVAPTARILLTHDKRISPRVKLKLSPLGFIGLVTSAGTRMGGMYQYIR